MNAVFQNKHIKTRLHLHHLPVETLLLLALDCCDDCCEVKNVTADSFTPEEEALEGPEFALATCVG